MTNSRGNTQQCSVPECARKRSARFLCRAHYQRLRRNAPISVPIGRRGRPRTGENTCGWIRITIGRDHPLADNKGRCLEHRLVLYQKIGPGWHRCAWCGRKVSWSRRWPYSSDALVVDHLDGQRSNNVSENLVASCGSCNSKRRTKNTSKN
jgi:hypothetical protein